MRVDNLKEIVNTNLLPGEDSICMMGEMKTMTEFKGFPREALPFLKDLAQNNNRPWFQEHKSEYEQVVLEPSLSFVVSFGEKLKSLSKGFNYDTRTNGSGSIMRIYRDVRFSKDKSPYHTYMRLRFWEGKGKAKDNPGIFIWIDGNEAGMHVGVHGFSKEHLRAYRDAVIDESSGAELDKSIKKVSSSGEYAIGGEHYKRTPRGYPDDHPRKNLLLHNSLHVSSPKIGADVITSRTFLDTCFEHARVMLPIHRWLVDLYSEV